MGLEIDNNIGYNTYAIGKKPIFAIGFLFFNIINIVIIFIMRSNPTKKVQ